jgi:CBS domain-containing protein
MPSHAPHPRQANAARPTFEHATVAQAMHYGVISCSPETPIRQVAATMAGKHVHAVVVDGIRGDVNGEHLVWGIVSDLDVVAAAEAGDQTTAGTMSATPAVTVAPEDRLSDAARLMREADVHHLIVVDPETERPVGVLSTLNIVGVIGFGVV